MTDAKDDDRAIDWAPRKIRDLDRRMNENSERLLRIEGWMARVTGEEIRAAFERELMPDEEPEEFSPPIGGRESSVRDWNIGPGAVVLPETGIRHTDSPKDKDAVLRKRRAVTPLGGLFSVGTPTRGVVRRDSEKMAEEWWDRGHVAATDEIESRVSAVLDQLDIHGRLRNEIMEAIRPKNWRS